MGWAIPIFSIRGTVIRIHITFLLFLVWLWAIFYRQGGAEAAWVYGRFVATIRQMFGVDTITVYPYQLGEDNKEALQSGAWWFYQKLGFRPRKATVVELMDQELQRIRRRPKHRS